jgi:V-type H+-transporting ATPase subunit D
LIKFRFTDLVKIITELASLQTSFIQLDRVIQVTNRRVNALELIVIPNIEDVIKYIDQELEEQERESKYIAKKVVERKGELEQMKEMMNLENEENDDLYQEEEIQEEYFMEDFDEESDDDLF